MQQEQHLDLSKYQIRTDLALESHQLALEEDGSETIPGVELEEFEEKGILVTKVHIKTEEGAKRVNKLPGTYLTIEAQELRRKDAEFQHEVTKLFAREFSQFLKEVGIKEEDSCLIVGLGNWNVTPDSLGPVTVENVLVTRHLFALAPEEVEEGYREVSAVSPGVLGITGMETGDIVQGIVSQTKPDFVIAIDALAARSIQRVNTTIQISNTGINPGSGIGNKRKAISKETLGIPVIAIGVPTVVDAVSIVSDSIDFMLGHFGKEMQHAEQQTEPRRALAPGGAAFSFGKPEKFNPDYIPDEEGRRTVLGLVGTLSEEEKRQFIYEVLKPLGHQLIVTPKEVDSFIADMGNLLANGLNMALHQSIDRENVSAYTY